MNKLTMKAYEEYLNELSPPYGDDRWIIGGKLRFYRMCTREYGKALREWDPIGFRMGFNEWKREKSK